MSSLARPDDAEQSLQGAHVAGLAQLRPIGIDDWSDVRYVHGSAFRTLIGPHVALRHIDDFLSTLDEPAYADHFGPSRLTGAWLGRELAGTVGWRSSASQGRVARIEGLFVQPLFTYMGLGSLLLAHAEAEARDAGFSSLTVLATPVSVPFFLRFGYDIYVQGAGLAHGASDLPLFLMRKQEAATAPHAGASRERSRPVPSISAPANAGVASSASREPDKALVED